MNRRAVIFVVGPTASGKSSLGLSLAKRFSGFILNGDSLQCYRKLDIGTAKPTVEERAQVPHFLFDSISPGETLTAGDYRKLALKTLENEIANGPAFIVGGSGFYLQALEKGLFDVPKPDPEIEEQVKEDFEAKGIQWAYSELERLDPNYAANISPNDGYRIQRALVILWETGQRVSDLQASFTAAAFPYAYMKLGFLPTREELLPRVQSRVGKMMRAGFLDEVRALVKDGHREWSPMLSVGYKECLDYLDGKLSESELIPKIVEKTMQLSKRQKSWFKRDPSTDWLPIDECAALAEAESKVRQFLEGES